MYYQLILLLSLAACSSAKEKSGGEAVYPLLLSSEGRHVAVGNPDFTKVIQNELTLQDLKELENRLADSLSIELTPRGFVQAANRANTEEADETNYDAVWVRDTLWVYQSLIERGQLDKARKVILSLWDYYSTPHQIERFRNILKNPKLAYEGGMNVPHIRFNAKDPELKDVMKDGKPEEWNHRQNDAHGFFLYGIAEGIEKGLITEADLTSQRKEVLNYFVPFFSAIEYWNYPDAGAWEEISKINTSSVAMVVRGLEAWQGNIKAQKLAGWDSKQAKRLISKGYERIRKNLIAGGESPDHDPASPQYRKADAALFNLFLPHPLKELNQTEKILAITIMEKLIRPYGVIRYQMDSYQSGNYWVKEKKAEGTPELTGDSSSDNAFEARAREFIPFSEAQWFFDSKLAMIYLQMAEKDKKFIVPAKIHFKRALGQVTPSEGRVFGADGKPVPNKAFPESLNTLVNDGARYVSPSPITPLNWAKASFAMALERMKNTLKSR